MTWVMFVAGAVLSWGVYGAMLHQGQTQLGNPLKALLCVGVAYFLVGVIVPVAALSAQGQLRRSTAAALRTATIAGDRSARSAPSASSGRSAAAAFRSTSCRSCSAARRSSTCCTR